MPYMDGSSLMEWDIEEEQKRVFFMEHMYRCSGRSDKNHPMHGFYTGLWQQFCINEAGTAMRDQWFERMQAIDDYLKAEKETQEGDPKQAFIPSFSD
jgi:hypothetical protein